jgi:Flp pilus assembly protein TadB
MLRALLPASPAPLRSSKRPVSRAERLAILLFVVTMVLTVGAVSALMIGRGYGLFVALVLVAFTATYTYAMVMAKRRLRAYEQLLDEHQTRS